MGEYWIVIEGNPVDGFAFHGPFDSSQEAMVYAEELGPDWWIAKLTKDI